MPVPLAQPAALIDTLSNALRADISAGSYAPGAVLPSAGRLAQTFGVSPGIVLDALALLEADGLIQPHDARHHRIVGAPSTSGLGFQAHQPSRIETGLEAQEVRIAIESEAARLAALRRSPAQLRTIKARAEAVAGLVADDLCHRDADFAFHFAVARACNNPKFCDFLLMQGRDILPSGSFTGDTRPNDMLEEHDEIVGAIEARNSEFARAAMRAHLEAALGRRRRMAALAPTLLSA
ncbi:MAG: FCD domain-containing protein [Pseudomonadota bacterium]